MNEQHLVLDQYSVKNQSFRILIFFLIFSLIGLSLIPYLSVQLEPNKNLPSLTVSAVVRGASPEVTDYEVVTPIESALSRLDGIKKISSISEAGSMELDIELNKEIDPELFRFEAATVLRQVFKKLPRGTSYPKIQVKKSKVNNGRRSSLIGYNLYGPGSPNEIVKIARETFGPFVAKIKGIYRFEINGSGSNVISIEEISDKMSAIGIDHSTLANKIAAGLNGEDIGFISDSVSGHNIVINPNIRGLDDLSRYPVAEKSGRIFTVRDLAVINSDTTKPNSYYRINGANLVTISFYPEANINVLKLSREIKMQIEAARSKLPKGYRILNSYDNASVIKKELNDIYLKTALSIGILLTFVFFLTKQIRYILIVLCAISANILISFIFYYLLKLELHIYSLAGITIALGLIIDNIIVIVEDIRHTGYNRIFRAIFTSTLLSLGTLLIIFLLDENQKINLYDFAVAIFVNLIVSLPVAFFFTPALLEKLPIKVNGRKFQIAKKRQVLKLNTLYIKIIKFVVRFRLTFLLLLMLTFGIPFFLMPEKMEGDGFFAMMYNKSIGSNFYNQNIRSKVNKYLGGILYMYLVRQADNYDPNAGKLSNNKTTIDINISMPNGATLEQMNQVCIGFEQFLNKYSNYIDVFTSIVWNPNNASINIVFKDGEVKFPPILKKMLEAQALVSGAADFEIYGVGQAFSNIANLYQYDSSLEIKGYNYSNLKAIGIRVKELLMVSSRVTGVYISSASRWEQKPYKELVMSFHDPELFSIYNRNKWQISNRLQEMQENIDIVGRIDVGGGRFLPLQVASNKAYQPNVWFTNNSPLNLGDTMFVKLKDIGKIDSIQMGEKIVKEDQSYHLNINYKFVGSIEMNRELKADIIKEMNGKLPLGYSITDDGDLFKREPNKKNNYLIFFPLLLLTTYLISSTFLESLIQPLAVVLMIPFSFIGAFLIFYFFKLDFDEGAGASLLMLAGIVSNSVLYIVNDMNHKQKMKSDKAYVLNNYIKAVNYKIVPIIITTVSAILSMAPFLMGNDQHGFWFVLSMGTVGGLLFSLIGIFILVPLCLIKRKDF